MYIDIDKINTYELRNKVNKIKGGMYMKLYMKLISYHLKQYQMFLCNNAKIMQMNLNLSHSRLKIT